MYRRGPKLAAEVLRYMGDGMGLDEAMAAYLAACEIEGRLSLGLSPGRDLRLFHVSK